MQLNIKTRNKIRQLIFNRLEKIRGSQFDCIYFLCVNFNDSFYVGKVVPQ